MKEISIGIIAAVLGGLITYFGSVQAGIITKYEAGAAAEQIIKTDELRNYLIRSMQDTQSFKGKQGPQGPAGRIGPQGIQGPSGTLKTTQLQALNFAVCKSQNLTKCCDHVNSNTKSDFPQLTSTCP